MTGLGQGLSQRRHHMGFAGSRATNQADVGRPGEELAPQKLADFAAQRRLIAVEVEGGDRFILRELRIEHEARDAPIGAVAGFWVTSSAR